MALLTVLNAEIFKDATLHLGMMTRGIEYDPRAFRACVEALRTFIREAHDLVVNSDKELVEVVDEAIRKFYPHHGRWDDPHLKRLLQSKVEVFESILNTDDPVDTTTLEPLFRFCQEMWIELAAYEKRIFRQSYPMAK